MKNWFELGIFLLALNLCVLSPVLGQFSSPAISVGVVVSDLASAKEFYVDIIGMSEVEGFTVNEKLSKTLGLTDGIPLEVTVLKLKDDPNASQWKLVSFNKKAAHPEQKYISDDTGMQYITLFLDDLKPVLERIKNNKIPLLGETPAPISNGNHLILVQDPDGTFIELIGKLKG